MAGTVEQEAAIWKKLHDNREEHIEQARRARDMQAQIASLVEITNTSIELAARAGDFALAVYEKQK